jgi:hypothetical protein
VAQFLSFSEQLARVSIDATRSAKAQDDLSYDTPSFFVDGLAAWRDRNRTQAFCKKEDEREKKERKKG